MSVIPDEGEYFRQAVDRAKQRLENCQRELDAKKAELKNKQGDPLFANDLAGIRSRIRILEEQLKDARQSFHYAHGRLAGKNSAAQRRVGSNGHCQSKPRLPVKVNPSVAVVPTVKQPRIKSPDVEVTFSPKNRRLTLRHVGSPQPILIDGQPDLLFPADDPDVLMRSVVRLVEVLTNCQVTQCNAPGTLPRYILEFPD